MAKVGSRSHKSTAVKKVAGVIPFKGHFIQANVYSKDGVYPLTYTSGEMANKMADRYSTETIRLHAEKPLRATCWYLVED